MAMLLPTRPARQPRAAPSSGVRHRHRRARDRLGARRRATRRRSPPTCRRRGCARFFAGSATATACARRCASSVLFAVHNCCATRRSRGSTWSSCRNLLIYLDRDVAAGGARDLPLRAAARRLPVPRHVRVGRRGARACSRRSTRGTASTAPTRSAGRSRPLRAAAARRRPPRSPAAGCRRRRDAAADPGRPAPRLLEQFAPPSVLVDAERDIVHMSQRAGALPALSPPASRRTHLLQRGAAGAAAGAAHRAVPGRSRSSTRVDAGAVRPTIDGQPVAACDMTVRPVRHAGAGRADCCWCCSTRPTTVDDGRARPPTPATDPVVAELEEELQRRSEQLHDDDRAVRDLDRGAQGVQRGAAGDQRGAALGDRGARDQQGRAAVDQRGADHRQPRAEDRRSRRPSEINDDLQNLIAVDRHRHGLRRPRPAHQALHAARRRRSST